MVAERNSRSGAPSNREPMSSRSSLMFLSVNGTAQSYGAAEDVPSRYMTSPPAARLPSTQVLIRACGQLYKRSSRRSWRATARLCDGSAGADAAERLPRGGDSGDEGPWLSKRTRSRTLSGGI